MAQAQKDPVAATETVIKKRKYHHNLEEERECEDESEVSSELTCAHLNMMKKPRMSEITSTNADNATEMQSSLNAIVDSTLPQKVSAELTLFDESWVANAAPDSLAVRPRIKEPLSNVAPKIAMMKFYSLADIEEERRQGVSTNLKLFDPWKIKKKLTISDLGNLCRLLVATDLVKHHVFPYLSEGQIKEVESDGAKVAVWDQDTETNHHLGLKHWSSAKSYVFNKGWKQDFVNRRNLREGDDIGLYWDLCHARFNFCVLKQANSDQLK